MKTESKFSFKNRLASFRYAFQGIRTLVIGEHNMWIHLTLAFLAVVAGFYLRISVIEWSLIIICIGVVLSAEGFNTCIEYLCDKITITEDPLIKKIKDISAAAVLISSIMAAIVGILIFGPKFLEL
ncbi:MAG: diacylglycerol kinase family protein [Bacteroidia bacterium]|nr:diacylglycerol kinase family protein [Bacteroidia bacterium]